MNKKLLKRMVNPCVVVLTCVIISSLIYVALNPIQNYFDSNRLEQYSEYETLSIEPSDSSSQSVSFLNKKVDTFALLFEESDNSLVSVSISELDTKLIEGNIFNNEIKVPLPKLDTYVDSGLTLKITNLSDKTIMLRVKSLDKKALKSYNNVLFDISGSDTLFRTAIMLVSIVTLIAIIVFSYWWNLVYCKRKFGSIVENCFNFLLKYKMQFVVLSALSIGTAFLLLNVLVDFKYLQTIYLNDLGLLFCLLAILLWLLFYLISHYKNDIPHLFVTIAVPICIMYILFIVPNGAPDELAHFYKTYLTSTIDFKNSASTNVPMDFVATTKYNYLTLRNAVFIPNNLASESMVVPVISYNFVLYIASGFGLLVSRLLGFTIMGGYLVARLMNTLLFICLGYFSIKKIPFAKVPLMIFMLSPMIIQQCTSVSADCVVIITCIFAISYMIYLYNMESEISWVDISILLTTFTIVVLTKFNYLPIFGLIFLSWKKVKLLGWKKIVFIVSIFVLSIVLCVLFKTILTEPQTMASNQIMVNVNPTLQFKRMISNPVDTLVVMATTIKSYWQFYLSTFVGNHLSWLNINVNAISVFGYAILLVISIFVYDENLKLKIKEKIWMLFLVIFMSLLLLVIFYLTWTDVGGRVIEGIQGRYFIPYLFILALVLVGKQKVLIQDFSLKSSYVLIVLHIFVLYNIYNFFSLVNV